MSVPAQSNSWLRAQRKSDLVELADSVGLKKYVCSFLFLFLFFFSGSLRLLSRRIVIFLRVSWSHFPSLASLFCLLFPERWRLCAAVRARIHCLRQARPRHAAASSFTSNSISFLSPFDHHVPSSICFFSLLPFPLILSCAQFQLPSSLARHPHCPKTKQTKKKKKAS